MFSGFTVRSCLFWKAKFHVVYPVSVCHDLPFHLVSSQLPIIYFRSLLNPTLFCCLRILSLTDVLTTRFTPLCAACIILCLLMHQTKNFFVEMKGWCIPCYLLNCSWHWLSKTKQNAVIGCHSPVIQYYLSSFNIFVNHLEDKIGHKFWDTPPQADALSH